MSEAGRPQKPSAAGSSSGPEPSLGASSTKAREASISRADTPPIRARDEESVRTPSSSLERHALRASGRVDNFRILEELGSGGMAVVYRAQDERLKRQVALKILHEHIASNPDNRDRFEREAQAVARLEHPNIVRIYGFSSPSAPLGYIAMELIEGETLRGFVDRRGFTYPEQALIACLPLVEALAHAHEHGIVHRDFKPENVMIDRTGVPKLMDFGLARILDAQTMTFTGAVLGSPAHMSPEMIEGATVDERVDLFAFGTVLYFLVTRSLPFDGKNPAVILNAILNGKYADPAVINPLVSEPLVRIIRRCLETRPDDRFASARELAGAIRTVLGELGFHNPEEEVRALFRDPDAYDDTFRARLLPALESLAQGAFEGGRIAVAIGHCDQLLAVQPDNRIARRLLDRIEARGRRRRSLGWIALVVAVVMLAGLFRWVLVAGPGAVEPPEDLAGADLLPNDDEDVLGNAATPGRQGDVSGAVPVLPVPGTDPLDEEQVAATTASGQDAARQVVAQGVAHGTGHGEAAALLERVQQAGLTITVHNAARITEHPDLRGNRRREEGGREEGGRQGSQGTPPVPVTPPGTGEGTGSEEGSEGREEPVLTRRIFLEIWPLTTNVRLNGRDLGSAGDLQRGIELAYGSYHLELKIPMLQGGRRVENFVVGRDSPERLTFRVPWPSGYLRFEARERGSVRFEGRVYSTDDRIEVEISGDEPMREVELILHPPEGMPSTRTVQVRTEGETVVAAPF